MSFELSLIYLKEVKIEEVHAKEQIRSSNNLTLAINIHRQIVLRKHTFRRGKVEMKKNRCEVFGVIPQVLENIPRRPMNIPCQQT